MNFMGLWVEDSLVASEPVSNLQDTKSGSMSAAKSSGGAWATHSWVRVRPVGGNARLFGSESFMVIGISW